VKDNKIIKIVATDNADKLGWNCNNEGCEKEGMWYKETPLPEDYVCKEGDDIRMFNKDWSLRPLEDLVEEGYIELTKASENDLEPTGTVLEKVERGQIVPKTDYDLVKEGSIELKDFQYIDEETKTIQVGDDDILLEKGRITEEEHYRRKAEEVRSERDYRIQAFEWRYARLGSEERMGKPPTDTLEDLDAYVQALRDVPDQKGFPYKIEWPEEP